MERKLVNFTTERPLSSPQYVPGSFRKQNSGNFHEGSNSDCHNLLIYSNTVLTKEKNQGADHDLFIRRYNIDADPVQ